jgi:DNA uptake protein ComE-like DNA-binding protein
MTFSITRTTLITLSLLLSATLCNAIDDKAAGAQQPASQPTASSKPVKNNAVIKGKSSAPAKLVDINSASAEELKTLPGIGDAEAAKIIASRPYGSKAWLVGHKILSEDKYPAIKDLIIAKQPYNDAAKNAALYKKK